jgi:hypothetical protein
MAKPKKKHGERKQISTHPTESELGRRHERVLLLINVGERLGKVLLLGLTVVGVAYFAVYKPIAVSAGKETFVTYTHSLFANIQIETWIAYGGTAAMGVAYVRERKQRLAERDAKDKRLRELESLIDPNVTSSGLSLDGQSSE